MMNLMREVLEKQERLRKEWKTEHIGTKYMNLEV